MAFTAFLAVILTAAVMYCFSRAAPPTPIEKPAPTPPPQPKIPFKLRPVCTPMPPTRAQTMEKIERGRERVRDIMNALHRTPLPYTPLQPFTYTWMTSSMALKPHTEPESSTSMTEVVTPTAEQAADVANLSAPQDYRPASVPPTSTASSVALEPSTEPPSTDNTSEMLTAHAANDAITLTTAANVATSHMGLRDVKSTPDTGGMLAAPGPANHLAPLERLPAVEQPHPSPTSASVVVPTGGSHSIPSEDRPLGDVAVASYPNLPRDFAVLMHLMVQIHGKKMELISQYNATESSNPGSGLALLNDYIHSEGMKAWAELMRSQLNEICQLVRQESSKISTNETLLTRGDFERFGLDGPEMVTLNQLFTHASTQDVGSFKAYRRVKSTLASIESLRELWAANGDNSSAARAVNHANTSIRPANPANAPTGFHCGSGTQQHDAEKPDINMGDGSSAAQIVNHTNANTNTRPANQTKAPTDVHYGAGGQEHDAEQPDINKGDSNDDAPQPGVSAGPPVPPTKSTGPLPAFGGASGQPSGNLSNGTQPQGGHPSTTQPTGLGPSTGNSLGAQPYGVTAPTTQPAGPLLPGLGLGGNADSNPNNITQSQAGMGAQPAVLPGTSNFDKNSTARQMKDLWTRMSVCRRELTALTNSSNPKTRNDWGDIESSTKFTNLCQEMAGAIDYIMNYCAPNSVWNETLFTNSDAASHGLSGMKMSSLHLWLARDPRPTQCNELMALKAAVRRPYNLWCKAK